jgi:hypothetical protein
MRHTLTIISLLTFSFAISQTTKRSIYNFQTDYYWDSTLYKSSIAFYYDLKNDKIYESNYPVKVYQYSKIIKDSPLVKKDIYYTDNFKYEPFSYRKNKDSISIVFFDYEKKKLSSHVNYILNSNDSVSFMLDKSNLINQQSKNGIYIDGKSKYLGIRTVFVNNHPKQTFCFEENHKTINADVRFYSVTEVYIDTATLVPLQFISRRYNMNDIYTNYFSITKIKTITNTIPKYAFQKDLTLYEDKSLKWTQKQRESFLRDYANDTKAEKYIKCLLNLLDGQLSFYNFDRNPIFKSIAVKSKCDEFMPKD